MVLLWYSKSSSYLNSVAHQSDTAPAENGFYMCLFFVMCLDCNVSLIDFIAVRQRGLLFVYIELIEFSKTLLSFFSIIKLYRNNFIGRIKKQLLLITFYV